MGPQVVVHRVLVAADVYTRYSLAIPGAALVTWGLILQSRTFKKSGLQRFSLDVIIAAIAFALYGGIGQLFASPSTIYPSSFLNSEVFLRWAGLPIQVFRALMAIISAIFIIHSLRAFDEENRLRIQELRKAQETGQKRLQSLRGEVLHRTVEAHEAGIKLVMLRSQQAHSVPVLASLLGLDPEES